MGDYLGLGEKRSWMIFIYPELNRSFEFPLWPTDGG